MHTDSISTYTHIHIHTVFGQADTRTHTHTEILHLHHSSFPAVTQELLYDGLLFLLLSLCVDFFSREEGSPIHAKLPSANMQPQRYSISAIHIFLPRMHFSLGKCFAHKVPGTVYEHLTFFLHTQILYRSHWSKSAPNEDDTFDGVERKIDTPEHLQRTQH